MAKTITVELTKAEAEAILAVLKLLLIPNDIAGADGAGAELHKAAMSGNVKLIHATYGTK